MKRSNEAQKGGKKPLKQQKLSFSSVKSSDSSDGNAGGRMIVFYFSFVGDIIFL